MHVGPRWLQNSHSTTMDEFFWQWWYLVITINRSIDGHIWDESSGQNLPSFSGKLILQSAGRSQPSGRDNEPAMGSLSRAFLGKILHFRLKNETLCSDKTTLLAPPFNLIRTSSKMSSKAVRVLISAALDISGRGGDSWRGGVRYRKSSIALNRTTKNCVLQEAGLAWEKMEHAIHLKKSHFLWKQPLELTFFITSNHQIFVKLRTWTLNSST